MTEIEVPTSDGHFLEILRQEVQRMDERTHALNDWVSALAEMHLPRSVVGEIAQAVDESWCVTASLNKARATFEEEFAEARELAGCGLHILGEGAA